MKRDILRSIFTLGGVLILSSCMGKSEEVSLFPEYDIAEINRQTLEADSLSRLTANQMNTLNGALLTTRQELVEFKEEQENVSPARLEELEVQLALLTEAFKDLYATVAAIKVLPQVKYKPVKPTRPKGFAVSSASAMFDGDEYDIYSRAMENFRNSFFLESRQLFSAQIEKYPEGRLVDRAHYWIGETYYSEKAYDLAVIAFAKAAKFSGSAKEDDALYKQALSYYRMGENDISRELFKTLISRYPASEYVQRCKNYLNKLGL